MNNKHGILNVIARAPFTVYYEGEATAVSAANQVGPFDVLPGHADFFSVLDPGQVIIEVPEGDLKDLVFGAYFIENAFVL